MTDRVDIGDATLPTMQECRDYLREHGHRLSSGIDKDGPHKGKYLLELRHSGFQWPVSYIRIYPSTLKHMIAEARSGRRMPQSVAEEIPKWLTQ